MADLDLPPAVLELINRYLPSHDHVEVLLRLAAEPDRRFTSDALLAELRVSRLVLETCLADLESAGLVGRDPSDGMWRYSPRFDALREGVKELAVAYNERPVTLVRAIYARPATPIQSFADAFRIRKPGD